MKKTILFIEEKTDIKKLKERFPNSLFVINYAWEFRNNYSKKIVNLKSYVGQDKNYLKNALCWLQRWANKEIICGSSFKKFLKFKSYSLYYLMEQGIFENSYNDCHALREVIYFIEVFLSMLKKEKPKKIIVLNDRKLGSSVLINICISKKISYKIIKHKTKLRDFHLLKIKAFLYLKEKIRGLISLFDKIEFQEDQKKVVFISYTKNLNYNKNIYNKILDPIFKEIKFNKFIIEIEYISLFSIKNLIKHCLYKKKNQIIFERFLDYKVNKEVSNHKNYIENKWKYLQQNDMFKKSFNYKGVDFWNIIEKKFELFFKVLLYDLIKKIHATDNLLDNLKPDLCILTDEGNVHGRVLTLVATQKKIKTLGIQHGIIHDSHVSYIIPKDYPRPSITAVGGIFYKKTLTKESSFKKKNVVITGQPRYDYLNNINNKNEILNKYNIDENKKKILWATQGRKVMEFREIISSIYKAVNEIANSQLIIKLHPNEKGTIKFFKKNKTLKPIIVKGSENILPLIYCCDLLITKSSTSAIEASLMKKPVIIVNLSGEKDVMDYVKEGIALGVYNELELKEKIKKVLYDEATKKRLMSNNNRYNYKHNYLNDNCATKRVIKLIKKMLG